MTVTRLPIFALGWRTAAVACIATLIVGAGLVAGSPAMGAGTPTVLSAEPESPSPSPSSSPDASPSPSPGLEPHDATLLAAPHDAGVFDTGSSLTVGARIDNRDETAMPAGTISLHVGVTPLATTEAITAWLRSTEVAIMLAEVGTAAVPALDGDSTLDREITVPRTNATLLGLSGGVYPVQVAYTTATGTLVDNTVITVADATSPSVSVVIPITGPALSRGVADAVTLNTLTATNGPLTAALRAAQESNAIVAVDPALIAAMRALGSTAPASVEEWLDAFTELPNDVIKLRFADADINTLVTADHADLDATSLSRYLEPSGFTEQSATSPPAPTPALYESVPTLDELLMIARAHTDLTWPAEGAATTATAEWAAQSGQTLLLSSAHVAATQPHATLDSSSADALVYDAELSRTLSDAATEADELLRNDDLAEALARAHLTDGDTLFIALDRGSVFDTAASVATVRALTDLSDGRLTGEYLARAQQPVAATLDPIDAPTERAAILTSLLANEPALAEMAVALADPTLITGAERAQILQLFSVAWTEKTSWPQQISAHRDEVELTLDAIEIEQLSTIQFLSSGSSIPLRVRNDLPFAATLKLWAQPDDFRLTVESPTVVEAQAGAVTKVLIPVTAGLGNGDVTIRFWLTAENNTRIAEPMFTEVYVRAEWEKFAIVGLSGLLVILLGGGIWRTIRKRRSLREVDTVIAHPPATKETDG